MIMVCLYQLYIQKYGQKKSLLDKSKHDAVASANETMSNFA